MPEQPRATRIPWFTPDELSEAQLALHSTFVAKRRAGIADVDGRLIGPFNFMLLNPSLGTVLERLGAALRFEGILTDVAREVVILLVARAEHSSFIWDAHAPVARALGVSDGQLASLRESGTTAGLDDVQVVVDLAANLIAIGDVTDDQYSAAREVVGDDGILEVIVLVNHYRMAATGLRVFGAPGGPTIPDERNGLRRRHR